MPITNYLNPESFRPQYDWKPKGVLAGMMYGNQMDDYNKLMEHQFALQKLGLENENIDLEQKKAGLPLKELERQLKTKTIGGQLPYAEGLASEDARAKIAGAQFEQTARGPEARRAKLAEFENQIKGYNIEQLKREAIIMDLILRQAMALGPQEGVRSAQEMRDNAIKSGYTISEALLDPSRWQDIQKGLANTQEQIRAMEMEKFKRDTVSEETKYKEKAATDRAKAANTRMMEAARISAGARGSNRAPTIPRLIVEANRLEREVGRDHPEYKAVVEDLSDLLNQRFNDIIMPKIERTQEYTDFRMRKIDREKDPTKKAAMEREFWAKKKEEYIISATKEITPSKPGDEKPKQNKTRMKFDSQGNLIP